MSLRSVEHASLARLSKDGHLFVHVCSALSAGQLWAHRAERYSDVCHVWDCGEPEGRRRNGVAGWCVMGAVESRVELIVRREAGTRSEVHSRAHLCRGAMI